VSVSKAKVQDKPVDDDLRDVRRWLDSCRAHAELGDYRMAHSVEDHTWVVALRIIARGECPNPSEIAREALKTEDIEFERWDF